MAGSVSALQNGLTKRLSSPGPAPSRFRIIADGDGNRATGTRPAPANLPAHESPGSAYTQALFVKDDSTEVASQATGTTHSDSLDSEASSPTTLSLDTYPPHPAPTRKRAPFQPNPTTKRPRLDLGSDMASNAPSEASPSLPAPSNTSRPTSSPSPSTAEASTAPPPKACLDTRTLTITPDVIPILWSCCQCAHQDPLERPGPAIVEHPCHSKFPLARKPRDAAERATMRSALETCSACGTRHCLRCAVSDAQGRPICTFGGRNLRADRLVPAGWACCACGRQHRGTARYRSDKFVWVEGLEGGRRGLAFWCPCSPPGKEGDEDTDMEREPHEVCEECTLINKYGERLGSLDTASFVLARDPPSCLRENFVWFNEQRKYLLRERNKVLEARRERRNDEDDATREQEDAETEEKIKEAAADFEAAREQVAKVKKWIQKFWEAVGAQRWEARMRKEAEEAAARVLDADAGADADAEKDTEDGHGRHDSGIGDSVAGEE